MNIIIGLGNVGDLYFNTRHNAGFMCIDKLASEHGISLRKRFKHVLIGEGEISGKPVVLAKPRTFVNLSGTAVKYLLTKFRCEPEELIVIYDDMDLTLGTVRLRAQGTGGSHRGIKSINSTIGVQSFPRLRIGISSPPRDVDKAVYVLGEFTRYEKKILEESLALSAEAINTCLRDGIQKAMNQFN